MSDIICYCGNQCDGDDCFCDECNGIITRSSYESLNEFCCDMIEYEEDIPYVINM